MRWLSTAFLFFFSLQLLSPLAFGSRRVDEKPYLCPGLLVGVHELPVVERLALRHILTESDQQYLDQLAVYAAREAHAGPPLELLDAYAEARRRIDAVVQHAAAMLVAEESLKGLYEEERGELRESLRTALVHLRAMLEKHRAFLDPSRGQPSAPADGRPAKGASLEFSDEHLETLWKHATGEETRGEAQRLASAAPWSRYAKIAYARVKTLSECSGILEVRTMGGFKKYDAASGRLGWYSVRIDMQWRLLFRWPSSAAAPVDVHVEDYHVD